MMGGMTASAGRVLVVEDEKDLAAMVGSYLQRAGYAVDLAFTGPDGVEAARSAEPDVVVLDLGLPGLDGIEVCRQLRTFTDCYVLMLTARTDEIDKIVGLSVGADDYITKPFSFRELVARIRAVGRRTVGAPTEGAALDEPVAAQRIGPLSVDPRTRRVYIDGDEVLLTAKEFDLLAFLATDVGAVRTRTEILENVWDAHWYGPTKTVDAHVASLRKKLGSHEWIQAVRGVGFRLEPPA